MQAKDEFWTGLRDILTLSLGVSIYGMAFGLLAVQAGFSIAQVATMGVAVFAGGSQIVAAQQVLDGAGVLAAVIAGLALNLRLLLVTASMRDIYAKRPLWQLALGVHMATDESWATTLAARANGRDVGFWYLVGAGACIFLFWQISTVSGAVFANFIPDPHQLGMDFAFTAAFLAIARSLWRGRKDLLPWLTAIFVVGLCLRGFGLASSWSLILGGVSGAAVAGFIHE